MNKKKNLEEKQPSKKQSVSIMISGVPGSGKSTVARLFAQFCEEYGLEHTVRDNNGGSEFAPLDEMVEAIRDTTLVKIQTEQQRERKLGTISKAIPNDGWASTATGYIPSEPDWDAMASLDSAVAAVQAVTIPIPVPDPQAW